MDAPRLADLTRIDLQKLQAADLMRALSAKAFAAHAALSPGEYFARQWPTSVSRDLVTRSFDPDLRVKAATAAGTTVDPAWAAALVPPSLVAAFVPAITAQSAILRLPLRRIPFGTSVPTQTTDASYAWVVQGGVKPISKFAFSNTTLDPTKVSGIIVVSKELALLSAPGSVPAMEAALAAGLSYFLDLQFLSPAISAIAGQRPASITNGLVAVTGGATLPEKVAALLSAFFTALPQASPLTTLVMSPATAGLLSASGLHPDLSVTGGRAYGVPVVTTPAAANLVIVLDASRVVIARDDQPVLDTSDEAAIEMDGAPTDPPAAAVVVTSFWQMDLIGIRSEWMITWKPAANSVAYTTV